MAWLSSSSLCQNERDVRECYERERERLERRVFSLVNLVISLIVNLLHRCPVEQAGCVLFSLSCVLGLISRFVEIGIGKAPFPKRVCMFMG